MRVRAASARAPVCPDPPQATATLHVSPDTPTAHTGWRALVHVSREERPALAWAFAFFFCLLLGYYILRSVREAIIAAEGTRLIPYVFTSVFFVMLALVPVYGALVARFPRRRILPVVFGLVVLILIGFSLLVATPGRHEWTAVAFAIFLSVMNLFTVSVFWSFMSDTFSPGQAARFFGVIAAGGSAGAIAGPLITATFVDHIGVPSLLLVSAFFYTLCLVAVFRLVPWARAQEAARGERCAEDPIGGDILAGAKLVFCDRMLFALVLHMFLAVSLGTALYNQQAAAVAAMNLDDAARTAYFARLDLAINIAALLIQVLLTRMLLTRYGPGPLLVIPALLLVAGMSGLALFHAAMLVAVVQVATRGMSFGLVSPARESIFTRVDREQRYKAKNFIDTVVYRGGDMATAWAFQGLSKGLGLGLPALAGVWAVVAVALVGTALWIARLVRDLPAGHPEQLRIVGRLGA